MLELIFSIFVSSSLLTVLKSFILLFRDNSEMLSVVKTKKDLSGDYCQEYFRSPVP